MSLDVSAIEIHAYFSVDFEIVWDAAINKMPELQREIEHILEQELGDEGGKPSVYG